MSTTQPMTPPAFDRLVRKCLRKDPDERWQARRDVTDELRWTAESSSIVSASTVVATAVQSASGGAPPVGDRGRRAARAGRCRVCRLAENQGRCTRGYVGGSRALHGWTAAGQRPSAAAEYRVRFLGLSPDGTTLAFQAEGPTGVNQLWMRKLDSAVAVPMPGTDGALSPFWSPDSRFIGFVADARLKKVPAAGGPVRTIVELNGRCLRHLEPSGHDCFQLRHPGADARFGCGRNVFSGNPARHRRK